MLHSHILGFPRIGKNRETKRCIEKFWAGDLELDEVQKFEKEAALQLVEVQKEAGLSLITLGCMHLYDHVLDMTAHLSALPQRFAEIDDLTERKFATARGLDNKPASDMSKWFNTNYHYIVPEWTPETKFELDCDAWLESLRAQHRAAGDSPTKLVLVGPITLLALGKTTDAKIVQKDLLESLVACYRDLIAKVAEIGIDWIQFDEPVLVTDIHPDLQQEAKGVYEQLKHEGIKIMLATYFEEVGSRVELLPDTIDALHVDVTESRDQVTQLLQELPASIALSIGIVDGRSVWRTNIAKTCTAIDAWISASGDRELMIGSSCSLLHVPASVETETDLPEPLANALSFAHEKLDEIAVLSWSTSKQRKRWVDAFKVASQSARSTFQEYRESFSHQKKSEKLREHRTPESRQRATQQRSNLKLPLFPTTTIGSLPQTSDIRKTRAAFRNGRIDEAEYNKEMYKHIDECVKVQEKVGLDVLVHGEPERNDMVEYFGELLDGIAVTKNGWVQSYGSRCVKPPIIHSDVSRSKPMTVQWITHAQSRTKKPMKGMLTGPVTILAWSFRRGDMKPESIAKQIATAIRGEVADLESNGIGVIQVDEPALRELLPLRKENWASYLRWAAQAFRLSTSSVAQNTQIHTHMCYSEFEDIIEGIIDLGSDVISIEQARSSMELVASLQKAGFEADVGPGVYDVHSQVVPSVEHMEELLDKAAEALDPSQLWVNPDCGLKTRQWREVKPALENMVKAAKKVRAKHTG